MTSIAGLFVFRDLAARLLGKVPMVLAVGVLAVSYYPVRHAAECKPYGSDLTASLLLVWLAVCWWQNPAHRRWLWGLAVAGPLAIHISNPAIFVAGGVSTRAGCAGVAIARSPARGWPSSLYNVLVASVFLGDVASVTAAQYAATQEFMLDYWAEGFPPWRPWSWCAWLAIDSRRRDDGLSRRG